MPPPGDLGAAVEDCWERLALPALRDYVALPALSPDFDPSWRTSGQLPAAASMLAAWCKAHLGAGEVVADEPGGGPPCVLVDLPAAPHPSGAAGDAGTVLVYGHYDKQPDLPGWSPGLSAYEAVRRAGRDGRDGLYGRGAADDGYACFAAAGAVLALRALGRAHPRVVLLLEGAEESGSPFLADQLARLVPRIGTPDLLVTLDSSCIDYERLWVSTSARGAVTGTLRVDVLERGIHSGQGGGVVPSSFRLLRQLLSRVEDEDTGDLPAFRVEIPDRRLEEMRRLAAEHGDAALRDPPVRTGLRLEGDGPLDRLRRQTWRAALEVVGIAGVPAPGAAGNVQRAFTEAKVSLRLPPTLPAQEAFRILCAAWATDPPAGAGVRFEPGMGADGWDAPPLPDWLTTTLGAASLAHFGRPAGFAGEGGSNPFLVALGAAFPQASQLALGLFGPGTGHHGPDERLDVLTAKRLTACLADVLAARAVRGAAV